jgi:hypothetical protein
MILQMFWSDLWSTSMLVRSSSAYGNDNNSHLSFVRTKLYLPDQALGEDNAIVIRVELPKVDGNTCIAGPQIQQRGLYSLSSVRDLLYHSSTLP